MQFFFWIYSEVFPLRGLNLRSHCTEHDSNASERFRIWIRLSINTFGWLFYFKDYINDYLNNVEGLVG